MKRTLLSLILGTTLFAIPADVELYFSPEGGCQQAILDAIAEADSSIDVAMYVFTEGDIARALIAAQDSGVLVRILLDGQNANQKYSKATFLANAGIPVRYETHSGLMHNKFAVLDGQKVLTGSFNWTASAEAFNDENLLVISSQPLAAKYETEFLEIWNAAHIYTP